MRFSEALVNKLMDHCAVYVGKALCYAFHPATLTHHIGHVVSAVTDSSAVVVYTINSAVLAAIKSGIVA